MAAGGRQLAPRALFGWIEARLEAERDQLALWLPVALGAGIAAWFLLPFREQWIAAMLAGSALLLAGVALGGGSRIGRAIAWFGGMFALGLALVWIRAGAIDVGTLDRPTVETFTAQIESIEAQPARDLVRVTLKRPSVEALPRRFRVNIANEDVPEGLRPQMWLRMRARLMPPPEAGVPGAYDFARRAWFERLGATGRAFGEIEIVRVDEIHGLASRLSDERMRLAAHIRGAVDGGAGAIAATLATGDRSGIAEADAEAMRRSGLAHLLAISGLHVTAVIGVTMLIVLKLLALSPRLALRFPLILIAAGAGAVTGLAYTLFTGAEVPTVRACVAAMLVLGGIALGREAITLRLVAVGALFVLLLWPETLVGPSFQLSFAAVIAIVALHEQSWVKRLLSRRDERWWRKIGRFGLGLLMTGLAVEFALMPIALYHFNKAGLYGALANIVAIPLTTFVVIPLEALALLLDLVGLGAPIWWLVGEALLLILGLAHRVSSAPGAVALLPSMPVPAFGLILAGGLWVFLWKTSWRLWGIVAVAVGSLMALLQSTPDLYVTGDGRHLAVRDADGALALLRPRAGDYVRDMLNETAGTEALATDLAKLPASWCSSDSCRWTMWRGGRQWRIFATRSSYYLPIEAMRRECAAADIVVSDRRLPASCTPRWLKIDRDMLRETGGLAIDLDRAGVETVRIPGDDHPWRLRPSRPRRPRPQ